MGHTLQEDNKTNEDSYNQEILPLLPVKSKDKKKNKKVKTSLNGFFLSQFFSLIVSKL
jgi:hypothetical protein